MTNQSSVSICDRLKQRYGNYAQDWQSSFQGQNSRDMKFIRYIVNFIIEQAKHNIVISELPDVIQTLHCEAESIIRKNRMITLEEAISHVQTAGTMKYPYLKKVKPISTEDFVKEVLREVFSRLGTVITLDKIENMCRFITCSAQQLLHAMPAIDVNETATLVIEDISRHQRENDKNQKGDNTAERKRTDNEGKSSRSTHNSNESQNKITLAKQSDFRDLPMARKTSKSPKNSATSQLDKKKQQAQTNNQTSFKNSPFNANSHFAQTLMINPFVTAQQHKSMKDTKPIQGASSTSIAPDTCLTEECRLLETEQKAISARQLNMINEKTERSTRKSIVENPFHDESEAQTEEIINPLTPDLFPISNNSLPNQTSSAIMTENSTSWDQKVKLAKSKSNTQTYSIHSEEGLSIQTRKRSKQPSTNFTPYPNTAFYSKNRPFPIEAMNNLEVPQSIRHYSKYCSQYFDISDNDDPVSDIDTEYCPLEDILDRRFNHQLDITL